jgi:hypothetical protein
VHLTSLRAAGCPGLTLNAMQGFPELRHLDLSGCDCIAPATAVCSRQPVFLALREQQLLSKINIFLACQACTVSVILHAVPTGIKGGSDIGRLPSLRCYLDDDCLCAGRYLRWNGGPTWSH